MEHLIEIIGLSGVTLVLSGTSVLHDFREWCKRFTHPTNMFRLLGISLEFVGIVTDKTLPLALIIGMLWWWPKEGPGEALILGGIVALVAYAADMAYAMMHAVTKRLMGSSGPPAAPTTIPNQMFGPPKDRALTEEEAHAALDYGEEDA